MAKKFDMSKAMGSTPKKKVVSKTTAAPKIEEAAKKIHNPEMSYRRTTVHIETDLYKKLAFIAVERDESFKKTLNEVIRKGLSK